MQGKSMQNIKTWSIQKLALFTKNIFIRHGNSPVNPSDFDYTKCFNADKLSGGGKDVQYKIVYGKYYLIFLL